MWCVSGGKGEGEGDKGAGDRRGAGVHGAFSWGFRTQGCLFAALDKMHKHQRLGSLLYALKNLFTDHSRPVLRENDCPHSMLSLTHLFSFILLKNNQEHMHRPLWTSAGTRGPGTRSNRTRRGFRRTQMCILPLRSGLPLPGRGLASPRRRVLLCERGSQ